MTISEFSSFLGLVILNRGYKGVFKEKPTNTPLLNNIAMNKITVSILSTALILLLVGCHIEQTVIQGMTP